MGRDGTFSRPQKDFAGVSPAMFESIYLFIYLHIIVAIQWIPLEGLTWSAGVNGDGVTLCRNALRIRALSLLSRKPLFSPMRIYWFTRTRRHFQYLWDFWPKSLQFVHARGFSVLKFNNDSFKIFKRVVKLFIPY